MSNPEMYASSSTSASDGHGSGLLRKEKGEKQDYRAAVTDGALDDNLLWVVKRPVCVRLSETAEKGSRDNSDINVIVRLLAGDTNKQKKPRPPEPAKRPPRRAEGTSRFRVYQVQRRGESSAKLVTEKSITQKLKSLSQQSRSHAGFEFRHNGVPQKLGNLGAPSYSRVFPQVKTTLIAPEAAQGEAQMRSAPSNTHPGRDATEQHAAMEETNGGIKQIKALGNVTTLVPSSTALPSRSQPVSSGSVEENQLQGNPVKRRSAAPWRDAFESTRWTVQDLSQLPESVKPHRVSSIAQRGSQSPTCEQKNVFASPFASRSLQHAASHQFKSSWPPIAGVSNDFLNVQKLCYWQPYRDNEPLSPVLRQLPSSTPPACASEYTSRQQPNPSEDFRPCLVRFAGCATDLTEMCGKRCDHAPDANGKQNAFAKNRDISGQTTVESSHPSEKEDPNWASQQGSFLQRVFQMGTASSAGPRGDNAEPTVSKEGGTERKLDASQQDTQHQSFLQKLFSLGKAPFIKHADEKTESSTESKGAREDVSASVQEALSTRKLPEEDSQSWKSASHRKEYAVFLPRRMRQEELRKPDEVPVIFRMLHRRGPKPRPVQHKATSLAPPSVAPAQRPVPKKSFRFRVLQQQQPKDDENRRLVAFKAPTHCRPRRAPPYNSHLQYEVVPSNGPSGTCASLCNGHARSLSSESSASSLVTLQYSHRRSYVQLPRAPVIEAQRLPDEFSGKVSVSPFAARVAQETVQRVARRRAVQRAKAQAESATEKETEKSHKGPPPPRASELLEKGEACTDVSWCCTVRDECEASQISAAEGEETVADPSATGGRDSDTQQTSSSGETDLESGISAGAFDAGQTRRTEYNDTAKQSGHLCEQVGAWLRGTPFGWRADTRKKPQTETRSPQCADAVQAVGGFQELEDRPCDDASSQTHIDSMSPCCGLGTPAESILPQDLPTQEYTPTHPSPGTGPSPSSAPYTEAVEGKSPGQEMGSPRAPLGIVTPPLYSLPVVSFLPPVFEPLPVIETVAVPTPVQLPSCYIAVPPSPSFMCIQETAGREGNVTVRNSSSTEASTLPNRVKLCILPNRGFVANA